jgi:hypothetical protein
MSEIIKPNIIQRDRNYDYFIDRKGNLCKKKYSIFTDKWTIITLIIIFLGSMYYLQAKDLPMAIKNIDHTCITYTAFKDAWMKQNPGEYPTTSDVLNMVRDDMTGIGEKDPLKVYVEKSSTQQRFVTWCNCDE